MIRTAPVARFLGIFLFILSAAMLTPVAVGAAMGDAQYWLCLTGAGPAAAAGAGLSFYGRRSHRERLTVRESLLLVMLIWTAACLFGAIPFAVTPHFPLFADAFFETASGFTTTGASVLPEVEVLPAGLQFWRHFTHWLGGMGIVLLMIAVLPVIGMGGVNLFRAHSAGGQGDRLKPRMLDTAGTLWRVYIAFTLAEYALLRAAGMTPMDAACHTFSSLGTGGFSTHTASVGFFASPAIEYILAFFMLMASINFTRHYQLWVERDARAFFGDAEIRWHLGLVLAATAAIAASLIAEKGYGWHLGIRAALFQVVSIISCTGFITEDYEKWAYAPQFLLFGLMWIGGNGGSTAGGIKTFRFMLLVKTVQHAFQRMLQPKRVLVVRFGGTVLEESQVRALLMMVMVSVAFYLGAVILVAGAGVDLLTSLTTVISCMSGVGPAWGTAGPAENYAGLSSAAKWILSACMLAGRVEIYTFLVLFTPQFWKE